MQITYHELMLDANIYDNVFFFYRFPQCYNIFVCILFHSLWRLFLHAIINKSIELDIKVRCAPKKSIFRSSGTIVRGKNWCSADIPLAFIIVDSEFSIRYALGLLCRSTNNCFQLLMQWQSYGQTDVLHFFFCEPWWALLYFIWMLELIFSVIVSKYVFIFP